MFEEQQVVREHRAVLGGFLLQGCAAAETMRALGILEHGGARARDVLRNVRELITVDRAARRRKPVGNRIEASAKPRSQFTHRMPSASVSSSSVASVVSLWGNLEERKRVTSPSTSTIAAAARLSSTTTRRSLSNRSAGSDADTQLNNRTVLVETRQMVQEIQASSTTLDPLRNDQLAVFGPLLDRLIAGDSEVELTDVPSTVLSGPNQAAWLNNEVRIIQIEQKTSEALDAAEELERKLAEVDTEMQRIDAVLMEHASTVADASTNVSNQPEQDQLALAAEPAAMATNRDAWVVLKPELEAERAWLLAQLRQLQREITSLEQERQQRLDENHRMTVRQNGLESLDGLESTQITLFKKVIERNELSALAGSSQGVELLETEIGNMTLAGVTLPPEVEKLAETMSPAELAEVSRTFTAGLSTPAVKLLSDYYPDPKDWYKLYIDPNDQTKAEQRNADNPGLYYDTGGGWPNHKSEGYQQSMVETYAKVLDNPNGLRREMNYEAYQELHESVAKYVTGKPMPMPTGTKDVPTWFPLRHEDTAQSPKQERLDGTQLLYDSRDAGREMMAGRIPVIPTKVVATAMPTLRSDMSVLTSYKLDEGPAYVNDAFVQYRRDIAIADSNKAKLEIIGRTIRQLQIIHPFEDYNRRVNNHVVLPKLLMENGFPPVMPDNSDKLFQGGFSKVEIAQTLQDTIQRDFPEQARESGLSFGTWDSRPGRTASTGTAAVGHSSINAVANTRLPPAVPANSAGAALNR